MDGQLFLILFWSGPIGLGTFIWLLTKADQVSKQTKAFVKEKELGKK